MKVYILRWGPSGEVSTRSVHQTLDGVKDAALPFTLDENDLETDTSEEVHDWDGGENFETSIGEDQDYWLAIEVEELLP